MKGNKRIAYSLFIFLISPILAIPVLIADIYKRRKGSLLCFSMVMGLVSYLLIPDWSLDLARYYVRYDEIGRYSFNDFILYLSETTDYMFYGLFYLFSQLGFKFQVLLFILSTFNFYVVLYIFDNVSSTYLSNRNSLYFFILSVLSISLLYYITATRFILATSFFLLFLYQLYFLNKKLLAILFFIFSVLTHIAIIYFLPFVFIITWLKNKKILISLSGLLICLSLFISFENVVAYVSNFIPGFSLKAQVYLEIERTSNLWAKISHFGSVLVGLAFIFLYFNRLPNKIINLFFVVYIAVVLTMPLHFIIYDRFVIPFKIVLSLVMIISWSFMATTKEIIRFKSLYLFMFSSFLLYTIYSIYFYRANFIGLFDIENFFLFTILQKTYDVTDFIYL